jgi:hypothetical protein
VGFRFDKNQIGLEARVLAGTSNRQWLNWSKARLQIYPFLKNIERDEGKSNYRRKYLDLQRPINTHL